MQRLQAYKFELKPNGEQQRNMRRFAGSCRFVFNKALGAINILRAGHARFACEVSDAARSPAAGTHRSDSVQRAALSAP